MKRRGSNYYFGIAVMVAGLGFLIVSVIRGDPRIFLSFAIVLIVGITLFVRELRGKRVAATKEKDEA